MPASPNGKRLLVGNVLGPDGVLAGGHVLVGTTGLIECVGCDCGDQAGAATVITCPGAAISPGLINTHDHITYAQNSPYTDTGERYEHRHDWRRGARGHTKIPASGSASADQVRWGELRFLFGGATSTVGSGSATGFLRNLDVASAQEGLGQKPVNFETFPLDDSGGTMRTSDCNYGGDADTSSTIANDDAYFPHVSEGIDNEARNEFLCLASGSYDTAAPGLSSDLVVPQSAFIHSIGLRANDYGQMAADGTALIWSPRSNITLYGDTAQVTQAARLGTLLTIGTDWVLTGSYNLQRELQCAADLNDTYYGGYFSHRDLWKMVTVNAAMASGIDDVTGVLAVGKQADIAIFAAGEFSNFGAAIFAKPEATALVMRGGKILYGEADVVAASASDCDAIEVCGEAKQLCAQSEAGKSLAALQAANASSYPIFFCGAPDNEPSCSPQREVSVNGSTTYTGIVSASDLDGDGLGNDADNCPNVFNPIRPVDNGAQGDFDADGEGDVCDVCPLNADTTSCSSINPNDSDGDGVLNAADNCPELANADQADADSDGKGDLCDACPNQANPGSQACGSTIYAIKNGTVAVGAAVALPAAVVTARGTRGFNLQVRSSDAGYAGEDYSGIFVFDNGTHALAVGDLVVMSSATVADFFGQRQLQNVTGVTVLSSGQALAPAIAVTPAEVATGGARAAQLEGTIVSVVDVAVTDIAPPLGSGDSAPANEFVVGGGLRINDFLYLTSPFPALGQGYDAITGVLAFRNGNSKLEPRGAADVVATLPTGPAFLTGLSPATSTIAAGGTVTLTVTLNYADGAEHVVALSQTPVSGTLPATVVVPAGQSTATFAYTDTSGAGTVITATLDGVSLQATVNVSAGATGLVINEIDYDQVSSPDGASFIEIYNGTSGDVALANLAVVLVNGANGLEYNRFALADAGATLPAGGYLLIHNSTVAAGGALSIIASGDFIQNGAPDGVALIDTSTQTLVDALSYEGSLTSATITGFAAPVSLVAGTATPAGDNGDPARSLARITNGADSGDDNVDWVTTVNITPGAANLP
ncbi:MAG: thrombospondin type 3 repeat-containing protein [Myxococcales bacterium]|nr:thrombospondin type 3 repeat-containing protein [Myxococcales bacterium]